MALYAKTSRRLYQSGQPIVVLMHGFSTSATSFADATLKRMASYGLFVIVPDMRGRGSSTGTPDCSAREIEDIYNAVEYAKANFTLDNAAISVVGYSGGGGNALAFACKYPDYASMIVSHFGMSDYGSDPTNGWYQNGAGIAYQPTLEAWVGGTPAAVPNSYKARDATVAIANFSGGHVYLFHDVDDSSVPIINSQRIVTAMSSAGLSNYTASYTQLGDPYRWTHGYPSVVTALIQTEAIWATAATAKAHPAWTIPATGTVTVIGYIKTKRFSIELKDHDSADWGLDATATVVYDTGTGIYTVTPAVAGIDVAVTQGVLTGSASDISTETQIVVS